MTVPAPRFQPGFRLFDGTVLNGYFDGAFAQPAGGQVQAGASSAATRGSGNISVQTSAAGNGNAADTTDDVLFAFTLPAKALDVAGRQLVIEAIGATAANGNNKQIKVWWGCTTAVVGSAVTGGTVIATSGTVTTNNGGWKAQATVTKYGAAGSNTQIAQGSTFAGAATEGVNVPVALTAPENAAIIIAVTGASGTTGAASDVVGNQLRVAFAN